jgi:hypothetical protein
LQRPTERELIPGVLFADSNQEAEMADDLKSVGKGDRIRASLQKHEVQYIAKKFKITGQAAFGAVRAAGPIREKVYAYIKAKQKAKR